MGLWLTHKVAGGARVSLPHQPPTTGAIEAMSLPTSPVFRQVAFPVPVFDHIKTTQRKLEAVTGHQLTINQTLAAIVLEHKRVTEERGVGNHDNQ